MGFSIVIPFLVFLVTRWGGNALVYGLIGAPILGPVIASLLDATAMGELSPVLAALGISAAVTLIIDHQILFLPMEEPIRTDPEQGSFQIGAVV